MLEPYHLVSRSKTEPLDCKIRTKPEVSPGHDCNQGYW